MWILVLQRIALDFALDVLYFPVWWYTAGAKNVFIACGKSIQTANRNMAPGLWLKNLFVPMFGQTDWQGRIMSVFMRLVNVIGRGIALFFWSVVVVLLFFVWLFIPVGIITMFLSALLV